jgi:hypothetical protein
MSQLRKLQHIWGCLHGEKRYRDGRVSAQLRLLLLWGERCEFGYYFSGPAKRFCSPIRELVVVNELCDFEVRPSVLEELGRTKPLLLDQPIPHKSNLFWFDQHF